MLLDPGDDEEGRTKEVVIAGYFRRLTGMTFQAVHEVLQQEEAKEDAIEGDDRHDGSSDEVQDRERTQQNGEEEEHAAEHHHAPSFDEGDAQRPLFPQKRSEAHDREDDLLEFTPEDVSAMGLDVWSKGDGDFVEELLSVWWGRKARVRGGRVECCGVRIL